MFYLKEYFYAMRKVILVFSLMAVSGLAAFAQTTAVDDYKKGEVYVGYSNGQIDTGLDTGNSAVDFFQDRKSSMASTFRVFIM